MSELSPVSVPVTEKRDSRWMAAVMWFAVALFAGAFLGSLTLLGGCATGRHVSRSYEVCRMTCDRVGCSRADAAELCAVAGAFPCLHAIAPQTRAVTMSRPPSGCERLTCERGRTTLA